eukprot:CAMPEP_0117046704 /NCGR_PEP_ID=MMETSP0472-20121206/32287_1 /TAXON_ID=693140 ORGANISM="Tiarina fusus, Strain LIS" /NCGR_SAMPLE_ID=MMETSP0472 /ASSEMBLY_ACC=CAM_ASM_000603 /LENGTH=143 /DNA_ID=CAMNT_0004759145 /DNA_START=95 /DNA_END=523 /DNA_ORIENTATION=+
MTNQLFITNLQSSADFRFLLSEEISSVPWEGVFFETKPISKGTLENEMEFVIVKSSAVASIVANKKPFLSHIQDGPLNGVVSFPNLGKDATLIVPCQNEGQNIQSYGHLLTFLRQVPAEQKDNLWKLVGDELENRLESGAPVW